MVEIVPMKAVLLELKGWPGHNDFIHCWHDIVLLLASLKFERLHVSKKSYETIANAVRSVRMYFGWI
jgi:hypothetical protein